MNIEEKMELLAGLKTAYAEAKADFEANTAEAREMIQNLEAEITAAVLEKGETVKTESISGLEQRKDHLGRKAAGRLRTGAPGHFSREKGRRTDGELQAGEEIMGIPRGTLSTPYAPGFLVER